MTLTKLKNGRQAGKNGRPPLAKIPSQSSDTLNASLNDIETRMAALVNEKIEIEKQWVEKIQNFWNSEFILNLLLRKSCDPIGLL